MSSIVKDQDPITLLSLMNVLKFLMEEEVFIVDDSLDIRLDDKIISTPAKRSLNLLNDILGDTLARVVPVGDNYEVVTISLFV